MKIVINDESFSYDVYSLVKAFYQYEDVKMDVDSGRGDKRPFSVAFLFDELSPENTAQRDDKVSPENMAKWDDKVNHENMAKGQDDVTASCEVEDKIIVAFEGEERKDYKNKIKREIYKFLSGKTGKVLPWGTLTGIRPTKLPMQMLRDYVNQQSPNNIDNNTDIVKNNIIKSGKNNTCNIGYANQQSPNNIDNNTDIVKNNIIKSEKNNTSNKSYVNLNYLNNDENFESVENSIKQQLAATYLVSDEKLDLSINIAKREMGIIDRLHTDNGYSLYIGIPFCPTTCMYCSFTSFPISRWEAHVDDYLDALKKEIDYVGQSFADKTLDTIYIGGGTPTTLDAIRLEALLSYINSTLDTKNVQEFCVEAGRPDSITEDKLIALKRGGVTRISVNPQTMNDETLKLIGRAHTVDDFYLSYELSQQYFDNINIDLILGLPNEDDEKVRHTFDAIKELNPNCLTVHSMAIKRAAHMDEFLKAHTDIKSEITDDMMKGLHNFTAELGLHPYYLYRQKNMTGNYENIGFAKEGYEGIYNISIMEEIQSIVALGAGSISKRVYPPASTNTSSRTASSYGRAGDAYNQSALADSINTAQASSNIRIERCDNVKDVSLYIEKIDEMIARKRILFGDE